MFYLCFLLILFGIFFIHSSSFICIYSARFSSVFTCVFAFLTHSVFSFGCLIFFIDNVLTWMVLAFFFLSFFSFSSSYSLSACGSFNTCYFFSFYISHTHSHTAFVNCMALPTLDKVLLCVFGFFVFIFK